MMTLKEKILYHQIHPWKLAVDIGCEPVSLYFFWQHNLLVGLATHLIPPVVASLLVIRYGHLEATKSSRVGAYLRHHMTRTVEGVRLAGDIVMVLGAWFHHPSLIASGLALVVVAWCSGMIRQPSSG
jgi:hypothetical protein